MPSPSSDAPSQPSDEAAPVIPEPVPDGGSAMGGAAHGPLMVVILGLITAIGPLSLDMYLPAFPAIADDLDVSAAQVQPRRCNCRSPPA